VPGKVTQALPDPTRPDQTLPDPTRAYQTPREPTRPFKTPPDSTGRYTRSVESSHFENSSSNYIHPKIRFWANSKLQELIIWEIRIDKNGVESERVRQTPGVDTFVSPQKVVCLVSVFFGPPGDYIHVGRLSAATCLWRPTLCVPSVGSGRVQ
jgi:hypothetical protein